MMKRALFFISVILLPVTKTFSQTQEISINDKGKGRIFEGIGALSAGASSKLLSDYPEEQKNQILDLLFKPRFGASLQQVKVEIGGDVNSTDATEPSHARTRDELLKPQPSFYRRGYEWMIMEEARKRNPSIFLDCLEWGCPGWIGNGKYYSQDNADYISAFLKGALQHHNLKIDYTGIWNEKQPDYEWIKQLRRTLDNNGFQDVKIIAVDFFNWEIADKMAKDKELYNAVYAMGIHYNERWADKPYSSTEIAQSLNKSIRNSEGGPWRGDWDGFEYLIKLYNRNYIEGKSTNVITWSLITSYYASLSLPNSGLMMAKTPWSGHFEIQPALWAAAHTTQFTEPGWRYLDSGCGYLKKGSYVTLRSPDNKECSIIVETADTSGTQTVTFHTDNSFSTHTLHVWKSTREKCEFEKQPDIRIKNNSFTLRLEGKSAYSITTTTGQTRGFYKSPEDIPFPLPYKTDFEDQETGRLASYFMDQAGVFEIAEREDGKGKCMKQVIDKQGIEWEVGPNPSVETVIGDTAWTDYEIQADFNITENTGSAKIMGRVMEVHRGNDHPEGYWFKITTGNNWALYSGSQKLASGKAGFQPFLWHTLSMKLKGSTISVTVDNKEIANVTDSKYSHGLAGLGSDFNFTEFDNLEIRRIQ
jgi:Glycosyl hydrolase family 59/Galactocerebrosidase, C-terminal lectin domain